MDPNVLCDQLEKLHEELRRVSSVDPRSSELLSEILEDIKRLMPQSSATSPLVASVSSSTPAAPAGPASSASAAGSSLSDRLEKIAVQFEVDHPTLAASSRRLIDLLGKAGL
jgi:hypothetical protein